MTGELKRLEQETVRLERLKVLAEEIRQEHQACFSAMRSGVEHALKVGELLLQARQDVWHGDWEEWVTLNCGFTPRTARTYMRVASHKNVLKTEEISEMTISSFLLTAETKTRLVDAGAVKTLEERKKERKERWKLENEHNQVKEYLDALKAFTQAVEDVIPVAEYGKFSPEAIRFTVRRHEGLRQKLERLHVVFRQKFEEHHEPGKTRKQELEYSPLAKKLGSLAKSLEDTLKEYLKVAGAADVHITELHYVVLLLWGITYSSKEYSDYFQALENEKYKKAGSEPGESE